MENFEEQVITELVVNGGDARSKALEAIRTARKGNIEQAELLINECNDSISKAHDFQTTIIQKTLNETDEKLEISLLMVHGQDHLMDAMVVRDIAVEMIELCKDLLCKNEGGSNE